MTDTPGTDARFAAPAPEVTADVGPQVVPASVLQDGEEIILAVKPSPWMIVLESLPTLALAGLVVVGVLLADFSPVPLPKNIKPTVIMVCGVVALLRLMMVTLRWMGRLYVLTNLRVMRMGGVAAVDICDCPLGRITAVVPMAASAERVLGIGSLIFTIDGQLSNELGWTNLARPLDVAEEVDRVLRRKRPRHG